MGFLDKIFRRGSDDAPDPAAEPDLAADPYSPELVREYGPNAQGLPPIFPRFQPVRPMPEATIENLASQVPEAVVEMWRTYGEGFVGDGYLRVLDPGTISPDGMLDPDAGAIALMNTALNDTIFWHGPVKAFICVKWRQGILDLVSLNDPADPRAVLTSLGDPAFQERALENRHFIEWVGRGGSVPDLTQGLYHVPAPAMGGPFISQTLKEGEALTSQMIYLQFDGPKLRHEDPDLITPSPDYGTPPAGA